MHSEYLAEKPGEKERFGWVMAGCNYWAAWPCIYKDSKPEVTYLLNYDAPSVVTRTWFSRPGIKSAMILTDDSSVLYCKSESDLIWNLGKLFFRQSNSGQAGHGSSSLPGVIDIAEHLIFMLLEINASSLINSFYAHLLFLSYFFQMEAICVYCVIWSYEIIDYVKINKKIMIPAKGAPRRAQEI